MHNFKVGDVVKILFSTYTGKKGTIIDIRKVWFIVQVEKQTGTIILFDTDMELISAMGTSTQITKNAFNTGDQVKVVKKLSKNLDKIGTVVDLINGKYTIKIDDKFFEYQATSLCEYVPSSTKTINAKCKEHEWVWYQPFHGERHEVCCKCPAKKNEE